MIILGIFKYIFENLEKRNINYFLSGSYALNLYAPPRTTRDIDIVADINLQNVDSFLEIFSEGYYFNKDAIIEDLKRRTLFNIIHLKEGFKFDFIPKKRDEISEMQFQRKKYLKIDGFHAWAISAEDLIISKLQWIQESKLPMQMKDIEELLTRKDLDTEYIRTWIVKLKLNTFKLF